MLTKDQQGDYDNNNTYLKYLSFLCTQRKLISAMGIFLSYTRVCTGILVIMPMRAPVFELRTPMCHSLRYPGGVSAHCRKGIE